MKPWMKYLLLGIVTYLGFVVTQLPAGKVYYFAESALKSQKVPLKIYGLKGTLWSGSASRIVFDGKEFNQFAWEIHPLALLTGNASMSVRFRNDKTVASATLFRSLSGNTRIENATARLDAMEILKMMNIPAFKLGGEFTLNLPYLELEEKMIKEITGRLVWANAQSKFPQKLNLGDLFANLKTDDAGIIKVDLGDGGGPLEMDGNLTITPEGKYDFNGEFASRNGRSSTLGRALGFMGKYNANGKSVLKKAGVVSEFGFLTN